MTPLRWLIPLVMLLSLARPGAAQERVRIEGWVVDEQSGETIPAVDIVVRAANDRYIGRTASDPEGRFSVTVDRVDAVWLFASRIGYADTRTPLLHFDGHSFFELEIRLDPAAILLAPLEVLSRRSGRRSPIFTDFDRRVRNGSGIYITRRDIERRNPMYVTDLLATVPGVRIEPSGAGHRRVVRMARTSGRECPVQIFVDGLLVTKRIWPVPGAPTAGFTIDDVASPNSVEGIEVYRGLSTVPAEFLTPEADCGVVAIWTRRGG